MVDFYDGGATPIGPEPLTFVENSATGDGNFAQYVASARRRDSSLLPTQFFTQRNFDFVKIDEVAVNSFLNQAGLTETDVAELAGAPDNATITLSTNSSSAPNRLNIDVSKINISKYAEGYLAKLALTRESESPNYVLTWKDAESRELPGLVTLTVLRSIDQAKHLTEAGKANIDHIETHATGHYGSDSHGHFTWPRIGFSLTVSPEPSDLPLDFRRSNYGIERIDRQYAIDRAILGSLEEQPWLSQNVRNRLGQWQSIAYAPSREARETMIVELNERAPITSNDLLLDANGEINRDAFNWLRNNAHEGNAIFDLQSEASWKILNHTAADLRISDTFFSSSRSPSPSLAGDSAPEDTIDGSEFHRQAQTLSVGPDLNLPLWLLSESGTQVESYGVGNTHYIGGNLFARGSYPATQFLPTPKTESTEIDLKTQGLFRQPETPEIELNLVESLSKQSGNTDENIFTFPPDNIEDIVAAGFDQLLSFPKTEVEGVTIFISPLDDELTQNEMQGITQALTSVNSFSESWQSFGENNSVSPRQDARELRQLSSDTLSSLRDSLADLNGETRKAATHLLDRVEQQVDISLARIDSTIDRLAADGTLKTVGEIASDTITMLLIPLAWILNLLGGAMASQS